LLSAGFLGRQRIVSRRALSYARIVIVEESDLLHGKE
jgi:hypothetical protein